MGQCSQSSDPYTKHVVVYLRSNGTEGSINAFFQVPSIDKQLGQTKFLRERFEVVPEFTRTAKNFRFVNQFKQLLVHIHTHVHKFYYIAWRKCIKQLHTMFMIERGRIMFKTLNRCTRT